MKSTLMYVAMVGLILLQLIGFAMDGLELTRGIVILLAVNVILQQKVIDSKNRMMNKHLDQ